MIRTPAPARLSASGWAASAGTAITATTISSSGDEALEVACITDRVRADLDAHLRGVRVEQRDDPEAVIGEDVGRGDGPAEVAGSEQRDVVLTGGPQDLADLLDKSIDAVTDTPLAKPAEAAEVAPDLGRVDVGVLGELLRGDRLLAHLAGLGQDLEVARQPRCHSQGQTVLGCRGLV